MLKDQLLNAALRYAQDLGWHVFPLIPGTKIPHKGTAGYREATTDPEIIKKWWRRWPASNIGLACRASGIVVVDVDVKRGDGYATWGELQGRLSFSTETPTSFTPSGGCHLFYRLDPQVELGQGTLGANVDLKWNGYVLLPPSRLDKRPGQVAGVYKWDPMLHPEELEPLSLPEPLLELLARREEKPQAERPQVGLLEELPKVVAALRRLSPARCDDYNGWLQVGMALRELGDVGLALWDDWSRQSEKWEPGVCAKKWSTLEPAKGITLGSLFHWAQEDGGGEDWEESEVWIPPLPEEVAAAEVEVDASNRWLDAYVDYALEVSPMTPRSFHEAAGLWLGAVAIARRLYVPMPHAYIWPNLFILWVAPTTLFAKTTGLSVCQALAQEGLSHLLLPHEVTPESLLSEMAGKDPPHLDDLPQEERENWEHARNFAAQRGLLLDEFSGLLAFAKKDYNLGLTEYILRWHDCPIRWRKRTQTQGLVVVRHAYFSILSTTTPAALAPYLTQQGWLSGFWPRFALLFPETDRPPFRRTEEEPRRPPELVEGLTRLANECLPIPTYPAPPQARPVRLSEEAKAAWRKYDKALRYDLLIGGVEESLWGWYGRLPTKALKVAIILAALDWDGKTEPVITLRHWARAQRIAETWRVSLHRLLAHMEEKAAEAMRPNLYYKQRILEIVREHGGQIAKRDLTLRLGSSEARREKWLPAYKTLLKEGKLEEVTGPKPQRGPAPLYVKIPKPVNV